MAIAKHRSFDVDIVIALYLTPLVILGLHGLCQSQNLS